MHISNRVFIVGCMSNAKSHVSTKQGILASQPRDWKELWANCLAGLEVLSCNAPVVVTLQLPLRASHVSHFGDLPITSQSWDSFELHTSWVLFTLFHKLPLHNSHLNIGYLIANLQENLAQNKANTWLNKFNLTCCVDKLPINLKLGI